MANDVDRVLAEALTLPTKARAEIAGRLLESLHDDEAADDQAEAAWRDEIERRAQEVRDGTAELEDWDTVSKELDARWRSR